MQANKNIRAIVENPFRVLGLPVDATDRQIAKRVNELTTLYEFGKAKDFDTDFPFISKLHRSSAAIERAARQIELPNQKLSHANFWFWNSNNIDDLVYEVLKDGSVKQAISLWEKRIQRNGLSKRTYSNYKNLGLLNLILSLRGEEPDYPVMAQAIEQIMSCFSDASFVEFCADVSGQTHDVQVMASKKLFVDELASHFDFLGEKTDARTAREFIKSFNSVSDEIQSYIKSSFVKAPIHRIENLLESVTESGRRNPKNIHQNAKTFFSAATVDLLFLKSVLSDKDLHYRSIADRVASQLLNSSTIYYNANHETDSATLDKSKQLTLLAQKVAVGEVTKKKVLDDLKQIEKLNFDNQINSLGVRFMATLKKLLDPKSMSVLDVKLLPQTLDDTLGQCQPILRKIKDIVGNSHESYIFYSDLLAKVCIGASIKCANETRGNIDPILKILNRVLHLKMNLETRKALISNMSILKANRNVENQQSSEGCYIATLVYGSYDAPEVVVLRCFRDESLVNSCVGRLFIYCYYKVSPSLVRGLKNHDGIQLLIRRLLSKLVEVLR